MIRKHLTLPNQLTFLRLLLIPVIAYAMLARFDWHNQLSMALYVTAAVTDTLDGQIARRRHQVSELGKFLDPLADKLLVLTVLTILVINVLLPLYVFVIIFAREFLITGLRSVAASQGVVVGASPWGKSKTLTQNVMIVLLMLEGAYGGLHTAAYVMVVIAVVATVLSGLDYLWRYRRFVLP